VYPREGTARLQSTIGAPKGGNCPAAVHHSQAKLKKKNTDIVDAMISKVKRDLLLSVNQPLDSADLEFIGIHFILFGATAPSRPGSPHSRGF